MHCTILPAFCLPSAFNISSFTFQQVAVEDERNSAKVDFVIGKSFSRIIDVNINFQNAFSKIITILNDTICALIIVIIGVFIIAMYSQFKVPNHLQGKKQILSCLK